MANASSLKMMAGPPCIITKRRLIESIRTLGRWSSGGIPLRSASRPFQGSHVSLTPKGIEPELLLVYLRLPLVCELLDLHTTASMYPAISTTDLMKIPIALPDEETRSQIAVKVRGSLDARREARRLLDEAKAMVERAILG